MVAVIEITVVVVQKKGQGKVHIFWRGKERNNKKTIEGGGEEAVIMLEVALKEQRRKGKGG